MTIRRKVDPILVAVLDVRFQAICEQIGRTLLRTSRSPIFAEVRDFATAIFDKDLRLIAQRDYIPTLAGALPVALKNIASACKGDINEGDIFIHNHPYAGNNHTPDIPVAPAVLVSCQMVGTPFWETAIESCKVAIGGFLVPYLFIWCPALLFEAQDPLLAVTGIISPIIVTITIQVIFVGHFLTGLSRLEKLLFGICTILLILSVAVKSYLPSHVFFIAGIALLFFAVRKQRSKKMRQMSSYV